MLFLIQLLAQYCRTSGWRHPKSILISALHRCSPKSIFLSPSNSKASVIFIPWTFISRIPLVGSAWQQFCHGIKKWCSCRVSAGCTHTHVTQSDLQHHRSHLSEAGMTCLFSTSSQVQNGRRMATKLNFWQNSKTTPLLTPHFSWASNLILPWPAVASADKAFPRL